jgi:hypothetical protein
MKEAIWTIYDLDDIKPEHNVGTDGTIPQIGRDKIVVFEAMESSRRDHCQLTHGYLDTTNPMIGVNGAVNLGFSGTVYKGVSKTAAEEAFQLAIERKEKDYQSLIRILNEFLLK